MRLNPKRRLLNTAGLIIRFQVAASNCPTNITVGGEASRRQRVGKWTLLNDGLGLQETVGSVEEVLLREIVVDPDIEGVLCQWNVESGLEA